MPRSNSPQLTITSSFAAPIIETRLPGCQDLNDCLRERFLEWEKHPPSQRSSAPTPVIKVAVYESSFDLFSHRDPKVQALREFCLNTLGYVIMKLNDYSDQEMSSLRIHEHSWYHITRHSGYTSQHNHPMASWSGVYCVDPGDQVPQCANNGALRFLDNRDRAGMYLDPGNAHMISPYGLGARAYFLVPGQLVLFPSWMMHEVAPYFGRRERITVAFNAWVREAGRPDDAPYVRVR